MKARKWLLMPVVQLRAGLLLPAATIACDVWRDANASFTVEIDDVVWLINYILSDGPPPVRDVC